MPKPATSNQQPAAPSPAHGGKRPGAGRPAEYPVPQERITIRLPHHLLQSLRDQADARSITLSEHIRALLEDATP